MPFRLEKRKIFQDNLCKTLGFSQAYWYQTLLTTPFPELPGKDDLEIG